MENHSDCVEIASCCCGNATEIETWLDTGAGLVETIGGDEEDYARNDCDDDAEDYARSDRDDDTENDVENGETSDDKDDDDDASENARSKQIESASEKKNVNATRNVPVGLGNEVGTHCGRSSATSTLTWNENETVCPQHSSRSLKDVEATCCGTECGSEMNGGAWREAERRGCGSAKGSCGVSAPPNGSCSSSSFASGYRPPPS